MAGKRDRMSGNEAVALAIKQVNPDVMPAFPITIRKASVIILSRSEGLSFPRAAHRISARKEAADPGTRLMISIPAVQIFPADPFFQFPCEPRQTFLILR